MKKKIKHFLRNRLKKNLPKRRQVLLIDGAKGEANAVVMANYLAQNYKFPVFFVVDKAAKAKMEFLFDSRVKLLITGSSKHHWVTFTSKYILSTHGYGQSGKNQVSVNLWHGVGHKSINKDRGMGGLPADITVATSPFTKKMLADFFDVPLQSVFISGYPRNDQLLRAKNKKERLLKRAGKQLQGYDKILFWMPTHRRKDPGIAFSSKGKKIDTVFNTENFDIRSFNALLKEQNALCLVKPHYYYQFDKEESKDAGNILLIDENWIWKQGLSLYELLACTDVLITDFSSVMTDFSLLDCPIICFCTDLEKVYAKKELYFEDIDNYLPSKIIQNQPEFFNTLATLLATGNDPYSNKRRKMRDLYFSYQDDKSAERLARHIFGERDS